MPDWTPTALRVLYPHPSLPYWQVSGSELAFSLSQPDVLKYAVL
jgi:hypothetical protein